MSELLPCPFCGSPARTDLLPHAGGPGWVQCSECECDQHISDTLEEAVARWNKRAPMPTAAQQAVEPLDEVFIEAWHGVRKITVYRSTVIRVWGKNIDTEMSNEPRTLNSVQAALDWLYAVPEGDQRQPVAASVVEALRPFAGIFAGIPPNLPDGFEILLKIDATPFARATVGDFRRADAALTAARDTEGK